MEYRNRNASPAAPGAPQVAPTAPGPVKNKKFTSESAWYRAGVASLVAIVVVLIVGVIVFVGTSNNSGDQFKNVKTDKLQAVFLNTGQVYFGNITSITANQFVLQNIYYLQTNSSSSTTTTSTSSSNVSLVKLGCELHQPYDQMFINRSEVTFWENLQSTGQVAKAVATFEQQNPHGQTCSDQSSAASTTSGTATQSAGTASTSGTSTTSGQ